MTDSGTVINNNFLENPLKKENKKRCKISPVAGNRIQVGL